MWRKVSAVLVSLCLVFQQLSFASVATELNLAGHLSKMSSAFTPERFRPVHIRFFSYDALNDNIKVMLDKGDVKNLKESQISASTQELLNYFLVGVNLPNDKFWVNLRPDSEDGIIDDYLARTDVGKVMLEADLQLKKDTAQFTSPQTPEGREYWSKLYQKAEELYGYQEVSIPTLTRPWIVPNEIIVRESKESAYIYKATLKVMLEQDFLKDSSVYNFKDARSKALNEYSSQLIRELILPKLTKEVNLSQRYAALRQVYYSLVLARWFKSRFNGQAGKYASRIDRKDLSGLLSATAWSKSSYFEAYKKSFAQGEYNIKETVRTPTGQVIRAYFSGGMDFATLTINGAKTTSSPMTTALMKAGLVAPGMPESTSSPVSIQVRRVSDLKDVVAAQGIDTGICVVDWNIPRKDLAKNKTDRIDQSVEAIKSAFNDINLQYLFVLTHLGRPADEKDAQKRFDDFNLKPTVDKARGILAKNGLNDVEIVLLPYDLSEARGVIRGYKAKSNGKRVMFVLDNIRLYPEEQLKVDKKAGDKEKAAVLALRKAFEEKIIGLTDRTVEKLVYLSEAFDKAHRGEEASMELAWLIPEQNRAAGPQLAKDIQAVIDFQVQVSKGVSFMAGGAKFDKYKNFGDLAESIAQSGGKLMIVGAQANPYLKAQGKEIGRSLLPKEKEQKDVDNGIEKIKKSGVEIILPKDFVVAGKGSSVALEELSLEDVQIDIGDQAIEEITDYINSLKKGDGLILNGGAGIFDKSEEEGGSRKGTIAIVAAANEAAERGVAVFFAGGDMNNAVNTAVDKMRKVDPHWQLSPNVRSSTGGGALLTALAKGVTSLPPVRAILKMDTGESLYMFHGSIKNTFPGGMILPTFSTLSEDTSIGGNDANRQAALDLFKEKGIYVAVSDGPFADRSKLFYDYVIVPVVVLEENLPADFKEKLVSAKDEKAVTALVQGYLREYLSNDGVNITEKQERSHKLDIGKLGVLSVDMPSLIAVKTSSNDLFVHIPVWLKRDHTAVEDLNAKIITELAEQKPILARALKTPLSWPKEMPDLSTPQASLNVLAKYAPLFFAEFSQSDTSHSGLLTKTVNNIQPQVLIDGQGIKYDARLGVFTSIKDQDAKVPGFGKNLERFLSDINNIQQLSFLLYLLATPGIDKVNQSGIVLENKQMQDAIISFYSRTYRHLLRMAQDDFNDIRVFEPLRAEIGSYVQKLNKAVRNNDALELNGATAETVIKHLESKGVMLSQSEKDNLDKVYARYADSSRVFAYDILQIAGILSENNFVAGFRNLKVDAEKTVLPSQKPYEAYDGTGRIGRLALALRLAGDVNAQEAGYTGRYLVRTRSLKGSTQEEKFSTALSSARDMFGDSVIRESGLEIMTKEGKLLPMADLIADKRISFETNREVLSVQLDFQTKALVPSAYSVSILLDNQKIGVVYFADVNQFNSGIKEELQKEGNSLVNIPRPTIVYEDGKQYYFGLLTDATPGGVEMGDQALIKSGEKLSGPTVWELAAKDNLEYTNEKLGDAAEELLRLREILGQIENARLPKDQEQLFIYIKAQIAKKLLLSMGGGIHFMGRYLQKLPFVKPSGAMYFTPTSCSTNGASYVTMALSTLFGGFGNRPLTILGTTFHMYTSGSDAKGVFGHFNPKSTGAAKGVKQHLAVTALFTALRTPTAYKDGTVDVVGGSLFDFLVQLPENVSEDLVRSYLARVGLEFPEVLRIFNETDKVNSRYRWQDTIAGLRTGSIVYDDYIQQVLGNIYRMPVGYDNEMSYSFKMAEFIAQLLLIRNRQEDTRILAQIAPLANTEGESASSPVEGIAAVLARGRIAELEKDIAGRYAEIKAINANTHANDREIQDFRNKLGMPFSTLSTIIRELQEKNLRNSEAVLRILDDIRGMANELARLQKEPAASSAIADNAKKGGIDFRPAATVINYQPMGNFSRLNPKLPVLSKAELAALDIDQELSGMERLVNNQVVPSGERIKEVLAACSQKGIFGANKERLMVLLVRIGIVEETQCCLQEASNEYKEALVLADSLA